MRAEEFIKWLKGRGWIFDRECRGSHKRFRHPPTGATIIVPWTLKETCRRTKNLKAQAIRLENEKSC